MNDLGSDTVPHALVADLVGLQGDFSRGGVQVECLPLAYSGCLGHARSNGGPDWLEDQVEHINQGYIDKESGLSPILEIVEFGVDQGIRELIDEESGIRRDLRGSYTAGLSSLGSDCLPDAVSRHRIGVQADLPRASLCRQVLSAKAKSLRHVRIRAVYRLTPNTKVVHRNGTAR